MEPDRRLFELLGLGIKEYTGWGWGIEAEYKGWGKGWGMTKPVPHGVACRTMGAMALEDFGRLVPL